MNRPTLLLCAIGLSACHSSSTTTSSPDMATASTSRCATPVAPTCTDQQIQDLPLYKTVDTGTITSTADGKGFESEIDATAGGFQPSDSYVYAKFTSTGLQPVAIGDEAAFQSTDWDIAFRRFVIRLNSGVSGPSCVQGARTTSTDYDSVTTEPAGLVYRAESYYTASCDLVPDGSGLGSPGTVLQSFWDYPGCVQMTNNVFVIWLADGRKVKLSVTHFYTPAEQTTCDMTNAEPSDDSTAAHLGVRWSVL